ncbi:hypothetical protein APTSU1_000938800 [Apodemus speciosus]|uniref:Uncharacterized protein n=1 Tax=Apodemus speciosus TaxID=105296 RepID=A0ABQ0F514_APOSI
MGKSQVYGSPTEKNREGCLEVGTEMVFTEDAMKDEDPLAEGVLWRRHEDSGRRNSYSPHGPVVEAVGGRRPSARELSPLVKRPQAQPLIGCGAGRK